MAVPMASRCVTVETVFAGGPRLQVPYFQRGFAWREEHAERLLSDLAEHAAGSGRIDWYPLGAIILAQGAGEPFAEVADGHQRLITLTILLALLRDLETDEARRRRLAACVLDGDGTPRFTTLPGSSDLLLAAVQREGATAEEPLIAEADLSPSEEAVLENREALSRRLGQMTAEARRTLADFLLERTMLVVISVGDERAARLLFSTMHETGVRPSPGDLLKSRVLGGCSTAVRARAQAVWEGLEARLGPERMEGLLLSLAAIRTRSIPREHPDVVIGQMLDLDSEADTERFVLEHLRNVGARHIDLIEAGRNPGATPGPARRRLQYLSWIIRHDTWRLPALHWLVKHGLEHPDTVTFLSRLEALAWVNVIRAEEAQRRDRRYLAVLSDIDSGRALGPQGALMVRVGERDEALAVLMGANFARRTYKLFLLLRLNAHYEGNDAVSVTPDATVEHVLPQRPAGGSGWAADFADEARAHGLKHMLGNLTLLTEAEQNRAANRDFAVKRGVYVDSAFDISRRLAAQDNWQPQTIEARTRELAADFLAALDLA